MNERFFAEEPTKAEIEELRRRARSVGMTGVFIDPRTYVFADRDDKPPAPRVGASGGKDPEEGPAEKRLFEDPDEQDAMDTADTGDGKEASEVNSDPAHGTESAGDGTSTDDDKIAPLALPTVPVVCISAIERLLDSLQTVERKDDARDQLGKRFKAMIARGPMRKLAILPTS